MKNVIECLQKRGFIDALTSEELLKASDSPLKVYCGFDPTSDSLHVGNLVGIMGLKWFQKFGHTPVVILGGATGRIGDPSGKSVERTLLDEKTLSHNVSCLGSFFEKILEKPFQLLDNYDWIGSMGVLEFLRDVGKHFGVGAMIGKETVRARLHQGISFTEFSYQILQAYDFYYLNQHHGVTVQMGGSDQWGNITAGIEFNRKKGGPQLFGLTFPLITRSDGKKFGKSEEGAIWLSSEKLSPYQFYQYLYLMPDADVIRLLKMLTFLELDEIDQIEADMEKNPNAAQRRLAAEVTRFIHGEEGVQSALRAIEGAGQKAELTAETLSEIAKDMPNVTKKNEEILGHTFVEVALAVGLVDSKSEGNRLLQARGAYYNNIRIENPSMVFAQQHLIDSKFLLLSAGKKKRILIQVE